MLDFLSKYISRSINILLEIDCSFYFFFLESFELLNFFSLFFLDVFEILKRESFFFIYIYFFSETDYFKRSILFDRIFIFICSSFIEYYKNIRINL